MPLATRILTLRAGPLRAFCVGAGIGGTATGIACWLGGAPPAMFTAVTAGEGIVAGLACTSIAERMAKDPSVRRWLVVGDRLGLICVGVIGVVGRTVWVQILRELPALASFCFFGGMIGGILLTVSGLVGLIRGITLLIRRPTPCDG